MKKYIRYISVCILTMLAVSCQQDTPLGTDTDEMVMTYSVEMPTMDASRVAVDGTKVNSLTVEAFEQDGEEWRSAYRKANITKNTDGKFYIDIPMMKGRSYKVVFWAQNSEVTAYNTNDLSHISVDYTDYSNDFESVENLDAFYYVDKVDDLESASGGKVELKRPFVFLNIDNQSQYTPVSTTLIVKQTYTSFYPLTGEMGNAIQNQEFVFTGAKEDGTIAACLVFVSPVSASLDVSLLINNGISVTNKDVTIETVKANHRYNLEGELVGAPMTHWSDKTELPYYDEANSRYVIQNEAQLAWWMNPVAEELKEGTTEILIEKDLNMQDIPMDALQIPAGIKLNGNDKTISNLKLSGGLLGNATNLEVQNLTISQAKVEATSGHVGVLVNTLTGSSTFTGVTITNSSATTSSGAAGGMVGYIQNKVSETLEVTFSNCTATDNKVNGSLTSGVYVGRFRGYNNSETLTFSSCNESSTTIEGASPYYVEGNEATWLAGNDYSDYSGWLGNEEYYRGTINYGDERYIPKWDGSTKITPLTEGTGNAAIKLIYSAFDLANCAGTNPGSIKFMTDVDMGTEIFEPLTSISKLFGEGKTIYNLKVETKYDTQNANGGGFIRRCTTSTIENITFNNADVKVTHVEGSEGDALASIVCGTAEGNNTMTNVKVVGGKLYGCNKMGGIAGYITGTFNATNCSVDGLSIENYDSGGKDSFGFKAKGEVGGAFGFINAHATISDCYVKNTTLNCEGVNNGTIWLIITTKKYAGRHVNEFIGDIRTVSGQTITITYNEANFEGNKYMNREDHYSECKYIGHCYYTNVTVLGQGIKDTKGKVTVNGKSITVVENY